MNGVCFAQRAGPATEEQIDADEMAQGNIRAYCDPSFCLECGTLVESYTLACSKCLPVSVHK
jgi:hypothetical protein